ncbi:alpha/beta hydrolase [Devosia sp.]|uniref:alpha/beta hydrolase n=1 Tax=Devosia sp. TaxID=1871048 RepID=UPI003266E662
MDQAPTDPFRTRDHVADFDRYVAVYSSRSTESRARHASRLDVAYGDDPAERLDLFLPPGPLKGRPVHLFIHGGYWRMFGKSDFSFIADSVVATGGIAAIMDYALMPTVRMQTIVDQVRRAAVWLVANAAELGGDAARLSISGHSAGAHLCCSLIDDQSPVSPTASLLLSGIYDLRPLQTSFLQPVLALTNDEVERFSPTRRSYSSNGRVELLVGEQETAPFHRQSAELTTVLRSAGVPASSQVLAQANHMSVVLDLGDTSTVAGRCLADLVAL